MNTLARKLGMTATHFTNFDGLLSSDVSTPGNLLRLGKAAMAQPAFRNVVKRKWYTLRAWPHRHHYFWRNTNLLLKRYPGVIGIKTGWTPAAGRVPAVRGDAPRAAEGEDQDAHRRGPRQRRHQLRLHVRRRGPAAELGIRPACTDTAADAAARDTEAHGRRLALLSVA